MKAKISVIVPVYKVEKYLTRCLTSILNQTLKDIEVILVNDGSPDGCPDICNKFALQDSRIKVIHKENQGLGLARNSGLSIATGDYVAFVDSDDFIEANMLEKLYDLANTTSLDTVYCGFIKFRSENDKEYISEVEKTIIFDNRDLIDLVILDMIGSEPNAFSDRRFQMSVWHAIYSRNLIVDNSIYFHSERELISEDIVFHIDYLSKASRLAFIPDPLYYYCINETSLSSSFRHDRFERYKDIYYYLLENYKINDIPGYKLRVDRLFIGYSRSLILSLSKYNLNIKEKKSIIKRICDDAVWNSLIGDYPYKVLPFKYRYFFELISGKHISIILLVLFIHKVKSKFS
ncbi:glycosyltransferase [Siphonobacter sp. SORGH_AS_1065]|uniref:glycosyltransferase n=1 Tax=Siphonobacter sp. SORGH_AS_1065 TaxID=3041795 RepID=UPI00278199BD|nr:glycosyltransferase [Siphonobacter sp. SORGH_AS_1065]MDQ1086634.1 glycosyltransferase involved in cell wall biosynthesis [Siphonobacter sp. SORGH_AS_1065]